MTWLKVDDGLWSHPKVLDLSDAALGLWLRALCWSSQHLTDGHLPASVLRPLGVHPDAPEVEALVSKRLWDETADGWVIHNYTEHQRTRAEVEEQRQKDARRKRQTRRDQPKASERTPDGIQQDHRDRVHAESARRGEESRGEKNSSSSPPPQPTTGGGAVDQALDLIAQRHLDQHQHRAARGERPTITNPVKWLATARTAATTQHRAQLEQLAERNPAWTPHELAAAVAPPPDTGPAPVRLPDFAGYDLPDTPAPPPTNIRTRLRETTA